MIGCQYRKERNTRTTPSQIEPQLALPTNRPSLAIPRRAAPPSYTRRFRVGANMARTISLFVVMMLSFLSFSPLSLSLPPSAASFPLPITDGLVAFYDMQEAAGEPRKSSFGSRPNVLYEAAFTSGVASKGERPKINATKIGRSDGTCAWCLCLLSVC